ncbi:cytochrome P450 [Mycena leptocephala]|nr:cytochrome P450 [Mycena leptocephala]
MELTPGVHFLARNLVVPGILVLLTHRAAAKFGIGVSIWTVLVASVSAPIAYLVARSVATERYHARDAKRMGARLAPRVRGKWPGNLDFISKLLQAYEIGYLAGSRIRYLAMVENVIFTTAPEHVQIILATDFANYIKGDKFRGAMQSVLGTINHIKNRMREGNAVDFQDLISRFNMDSATEFLFGSCEANNSVAFNDAMLQIAYRERAGWIWPIRIIPKSMRVVSKYLDPIIHEALEKKKRAETQIFEEPEDSTLLDELVKKTADPKVLRDEMSDTFSFSTGRDTTMGALTTLIYFLAMYPHVTARLREEILVAWGRQMYPYEDIKQMKYLRAVINETMRLYPPVPFNVRETIKATTWPSPTPGEKPIYIPAGVKFDVPTSDEFDPDRFLDERVQKYLFAYNEMSFFMIRLLQNFSSVSLHPEAAPPHGRVPADWSGKPGRKGIEQFRPKSHLTLYAWGGLWVKMKEA